MGRRLWNRNFVLLWQGQLISAAGDAVYRIAIGFWILAATGSTALMGALMAASVIPRILLSPLGGTWADRVDRKWLLVLSDLGAGIAVLLLGLAALVGTVEVWMAFAVAAVLGVASSLFDPAVDSAVADIVPSRRLSQANAALSLLGAAAAIAGNGLGGFLYQALGAAVLFVANGVSFILSAASELFLRIPPVQRRDRRPPFLSELRSGLELVRRDSGLRTIYVATGAAHVGTTAVFVLLVPLFHRGAHLGAGAYGVAMGAMAAGALAGFFGATALTVRAPQRLPLFLVLGIGQAACLAALPWLPGLGAMVPLMIMVGACLSVQDTLLTTALQLAVPQDMRGKVFGFRATVVLSLGAVAMAAAGFLAETVPIAHLIVAASLTTVGGLAVVGLAPATRKLLAREDASRS